MPGVDVDLERVHLGMCEPGVRLTSLPSVVNEDQKARLIFQLV